MTSVNFERPFLSGGTEEEQIRQLHDALIIMSEQLNFAVNNLISEVNALKKQIGT